MDGHHRLSAIVTYGKPVPMAVVRGVDRAIFSVIDTGAGRNNADILGMSGVKHRSAVAAMCKNLKCIRTGHWSGGSAGQTAQEVEDMLSSEPEILEWGAFANGGPRFTGLVSGSALASCMYEAQRINPHIEVSDFYEPLLDGVGLGEGSPILALRERLFRNHALGKEKTSQMYSALIIRGWNAWARGETMKLMRTPTSVPDIARLSPSRFPG